MPVGLYVNNGSSNLGAPATAASKLCTASSTPPTLMMMTTAPGESTCASSSASSISDFITDHSNTHLSQLVLSNANANGIKLLKQQQQQQQQAESSPIYYLNTPQTQPLVAKPEPQPQQKLFLNDLNVGVDSARPVLFVVLTPNDLQSLTNGGSVDSSLVKQLQYVAASTSAAPQPSKPQIATTKPVETNTTTVPKSATGSNCSSRTSSLNLNLDDALKLHSELESLLGGGKNGGPVSSQIGKNGSLDESKTATALNLPRNNIDYAIDAVLELCRREEASDETNSSSHSPIVTTTTPAKKKKKPAPQPPQARPQPQVHIEPSPPPPPTPPPAPLPQHIAPQQPQPATQSMSKSSKARTSYISSLIANRDKTVKTQTEQQPSAPATPNEDDKLKKSAQNIFSLLSTTTPTTSNTTAASNTNKSSQHLLHNPVQIQPKQVMKQTGRPSQAAEAPKPPLSTSHPVKGTTLMVVNHQQQAPKLVVSSSPLYANTSEPYPHANHHHGLLTLATAPDCANLKRLLAQPIEQGAGAGEKPTPNSEGELHMSLVEPSFDQSLIKVVIESLDCEPVAKSSKKKSNSPTAVKKGSNKPKPILSAPPAPPAAATAPAPTDKPPAPVAKRKRAAPARKPDTTRTTAPTIRIEPQPQPPQPNSNRPKKLKTIADIVKHQSVQLITVGGGSASLPQGGKSEQRFEEPLPPPPLSLPSSVLHNMHETTPTTTTKMSNEELTISWINHNHSHNHATMLMLNGGHHHENDCLSANKSSGPTTNDDMNIEQLLELELNTSATGHGQRESASSPIDKFIDLDDIDVNPLDCYRNGSSSSSTGSHQPQQQQQPGNKTSTSLDEFNLQFSVCSTSSSGFSEPSNFSTCSSICSSSSSSSASGSGGGGANLQPSYMNGLGGGGGGGAGSVFGDEASPYAPHTFVEHSPPLHHYHGHHHHHHHHLPSIQSHHHNLRLSISDQLLDNSQGVSNSNNSGSNSSQQSSKMLDWNILEFTTKPPTANTNSPVPSASSTASSSAASSSAAASSTSSSSSNTPSNAATSNPNSIPPIKSLLGLNVLGHQHHHHQFEAEFSTGTNNSDMINSQSMLAVLNANGGGAPTSGNSTGGGGGGGGSQVINCGENMFGGFNFFSDEIKLEI